MHFFGKKLFWLKPCSYKKIVFLHLYWTPSADLADEVVKVGAVRVAVPPQGELRQALPGGLGRAAWNWASCRQSRGIGNSFLLTFPLLFCSSSCSIVCIFIPFLVSIGTLGNFARETCNKKKYIYIAGVFCCIYMCYEIYAVLFVLFPKRI